ncbi:VOC family protein [Salmonella enterica subsp. enterica serovar Infantis]|uniref:VOC family protein n=9 Tax=Salmonella enterica TaxID=28901 RepID=A0A5U1SM28_SALER|nr:VOC family virulence protein [Salmonella enterica subsp. enterica]EAA0426559.1 VOC family protein [Salmonella enterica]EAA2738402.1 VOC family protein [Salmonella enterica subsp. enterica serovar Infantis]EAC1729115.1 VOC family protein [Salmonella enterica subsp. enterica serovar Takoradi]EAS6775825.1 VOC family protein [Salmonella enterica subsp. enterica serovar Give]EAU5253320.1 VOC family protein [Salmonella enterica subsp. enterica serovar Oranienburg]EAZ9449803.1 VOC family protein 
MLFFNVASLKYKHHESIQMIIDRIDHLVLTVSDISTTIRFYEEVLGFSAVTFKQNRKALIFGAQKINLHQQEMEFEPKASRPTPGSADLCFITSTPINDVVSEILQAGISIIEGPVERTGATGEIMSIYIRDPDGNLIEISQYV